MSFATNFIFNVFIQLKNEISDLKFQKGIRTGSEIFHQFLKLYYSEIISKNILSNIARFLPYAKSFLGTVHDTMQNAKSLLGEFSGPAKGLELTGALIIRTAMFEYFPISINPLISEFTRMVSDLDLLQKDLQWEQLPEIKMAANRLDQHIFMNKFIFKLLVGYNFYLAEN